MTVNHVPEAPQSASGDYAWLGAEPGSVADQLYMSAADEWNQAINSRFVNEMLDDTLPESILKSYLIQDFKFFNQGIMSHAIELAPRQETKDMLANNRNGLLIMRQHTLRDSLRNMELLTKNIIIPNKLRQIASIANISPNWFRERGKS